MPSVQERQPSDPQATQRPSPSPGPGPSETNPVKPHKQQKALPSYNVATASPASKQWQRLVLTTTSLRNVIVANKSDAIYYEVITPRWARSSTTVSRLDPNTHQFDVIGEMRNDEHGKASVVSLYGAAPRAVGEWLVREAGEEVEKQIDKELEREREEDHDRASENTHSSKDSTKSALLGQPRVIRRASFVGKDGKKYTWKVGQKSLELVREDLPDNQPVAVYHREKRYMHVLRMSQHPYLEITPAAMDTLDSLILSFLLVERRRRDGSL